MSEVSGVSWTDSSWGPWYGCVRRSEGCKNCFAERDMEKFGKNFNVVKRAVGFNKPTSWKAGRKIFVTPWSDFFIEEADQWRDEAWSIIRQTPRHTYQILTKRPERIADHLPADYGDGAAYKHVWFGVSVENQRWVERIYTLADAVPNATRFVSAEPLLGAVDLSFAHRTRNDAKAPIELISWLIAGGESGPAHRPMDEAWMRTLRDQCAANGVAFFAKQMSGWPSQHGRDIPEDLRIFEFPSPSRPVQGETKG